ncbi:MAG: LacI family DNA-binding transcriptional regulator [Coprococcus sp.]
MTLKDIAKEAGVSTMTVSNVVNGRYDRVSEKTVQRVGEIIKKYNYTPNMSARSLASRNSKIIFLIIPLSHNETNMFYSPYISSLLGIMEYQLRIHGYYAMIRSVYDFDELDALFKNWPADGAIILLPDFDSFLDRILDNIHIPLVFLDSCHTRSDLINVGCNDEKGTYLSTRYLINQDHRNIAFMADYKGSDLLTARFRGYCRALEESHIPLQEDLIFEFPPDYVHGILVGQAIASSQKDISAIVTTSDYAAVGVIEGARLGGLKLPTQLSVIGFDDLPFCQYCSPKLTTISQNIELKAQTAINLLLEKLTSGTLKQNKVTVDVHLVERQSVTFYV